MADIYNSDRSPCGKLNEYGKLNSEQPLETLAEMGVLMKRTLMQIYTRGSADAVATYQKAFGAELGYNVKHTDGSYYHSELDVQGQIIAVAERPLHIGDGVTGNAMQFCLEFGEGGEQALAAAYEVLKEGAEIFIPLGPCEFSAAMADLIDRFGVRWCLFI